MCWLEDPTGTRRYLDSVATVGRAEGNDIRLTSPTVSRYHAMLRSLGGRWVVVDLDSRNGTRVRGERIRGPRILQPNDPVQFGETAFVFRTPDERPSSLASPARQPLHAHASGHFRLLCYPGSFAEQHHEVIAVRLKRTYAALAEILGPMPNSEPISVYLLDQITHPEQPDRPLDSGGYARPGERRVYAVYRPESPGVSLEEDLLEVAGSGVAGFERWPQTLKEGVLLFVTRRANPDQATDEQWAPLLAAFEQETVPPLGKIISHAEPENPGVDALAIANLLEYAAATYSMQSLPVFLAQISRTSLDGASRAAFGKSIKSLEKKWRRKLQPSSFSSFGIFMSLLMPYLRPYWFKVVEVMFYVVLTAAFSVALAKMNGYLIDKALIPRNYHAFEVIMLILVLAFVIASLASLRQDYVTAWISERILRTMRLSMFSRIQALHAGYFDKVDSGDLMTRMSSDLSMVEGAMTQGIIQAAQMTLMMVMAMVVIFFTEWKLAFIVVVAMPIFLMVGRYLGRPVSKLSLEYQTDLSAVSSDVHENLATLPIVKLFGLQETVIERFTQKLDKLFRTGLRLSFMSGLYGVTSNSASSFIQLAVLGFGGYLVLHGRTTTGAIFAFIMLIGQVVSPMQSLTSLFQFVQRATGSMKRVSEVLTARPAIEDAPNARELGRLSHELRFEHVSFSYDGSRRVLEDVNLMIPAGANVAVVGPSGSGKSSVLSLLPRFYDPMYGRVLLDGVDLCEASLRSLRGQMAMVFQESVLFNDTIRENIRMGNPSASDAEVEAAARAAEIHEFIMELPDGYDTMVGERGGHLSGGQRQRVAIARAIVRDPALLLLDEATSALDPSTEASINATLRRLSRGRTTISVTHRLASVVDMDRIFVFQSGRLVEQGTHQELLASDGVYAQLWEEQHRGAGLSVAQNLVEVEYLSHVPLFSGLDQSTLLWLASNLKSERFAPGTTLMQQGEIGDRLYLIREGEVDVLVGERDGFGRKLATLHEGDYVGEIALLREVRRTATVRARTNVEAYSLSQESFKAMIAASPAIQVAVSQTVAQRERELREIAVVGVG